MDRATITRDSRELWFRTDGDATGEIALRQRQPEIALRETAAAPTPQRQADFPTLAGRHILVIGINYSPEPSGIAPYTTGVADELARHADEVTVVTGMPHYPSWSVAREHRKFHHEEPHEPGQPRVIRLSHYVPSRQTAIRRAAYELTFLLHVLWAARRLPRRPDLIVSATPALGGAVAAARLARWLDVPLLTIVQDLMAKAAGQSGIKGAGSLVRRVTATLEGFALRHATRVAVVTNAFRPTVEAYGVASERIDHLPNWTHVQPSTVDRREARRRLGWSRHTFIAAHTGNIGLKQDLGNLVEAARLFGEDSGAEILVIGDGSQRAALARQSEGVNAIQLLDPLDDDAYPLALAAADVLLINERPSVGDMSLPSKLTSYLAAGRPVLAAVADDGATASELRRTKGAGHLVPPGDPEALAVRCATCASMSDAAQPCRRLPCATPTGALGWRGP
ncbi:MAG: glycosyltransferase family 4 protein [Kineosporiaceae bacterium]|nr:glycosyltransferase family 4 protein [Kineosporiaceae bacterium]